MTTDYGNFRQRLDAVLRTLDVQQVKAFLIAEKQWDEEKPEDPEFAMWIMVAGSPTLRDLHERAYEWLMSHGHEEDAKVYLARDKKQGQGVKPVKKDGGGKRASGGKPPDGRGNPKSKSHNSYDNRL